MAEKRLSMKKTLGFVGCGVFFCVCIIAALKVRVAADVGAILWPLTGLIGLLFGIKTFGGVMAKRIEMERKDTSDMR